MWSNLESYFVLFSRNHQLMIMLYRQSTGGVNGNTADSEL